YQFILAASPMLTEQSLSHDAPLQTLKPIDASWHTWGRMHTELALAHAELERVYATRSWKMLRRGATAWRSIQARFTLD
ncbi:MAG: class I SAM-dependent methyltransferase, partial [Thiothrix sp.]